MDLHFPWILEHTKEVTDLQWLIVTGIGFIFLSWLAVKKVWPGMVQPHLEERQKAIAHAAEQVDSTLRETEEMRNDYLRRLEEIQEETRRRLEEAVQESDRLRETILAEARETAAALVRRGEAEVGRERAKMHSRLRTEFVEGVINAARHAAVTSIDSANRKRLLSEFVKDLGGAS